MSDDIPDLPTLEAWADETVHWLIRLHGEIDQPVKRDINSQVKTPKVTGSPAPWNAQIAGVMTDVEAKARQHTAVLRRVLRHTTPPMSASTEASRTAILALPGLVNAARTPFPDHARDAFLDLRRWPRLIRGVLDLARPDEVREMTLDTPCPYCGEKLRARADGTSDIVCRTPYCHSHDGVPCTDLRRCTVTYDRLRYRWARQDWSRLLDELGRNSA